jgi:hypothetical protein
MDSHHRVRLNIFSTIGSSGALVYNGMFFAVFARYGNFNTKKPNFSVEKLAF